MLNATEIWALRQVPALLAQAHNPWWVIGAAAAKLHGADLGPLKAVEVVVSPGDARRILDELGLENTAKSAAMPLVRSRMLGVGSVGELKLDILSSLEARAGGAWQGVTPKSRVALKVEGAELFVPDCDEMLAIFATLGRPKDLRRAEALRTVCMGRRPG